MIGPRLNPYLLETPLYIAGKSIDQVMEELGLDEVVKMASNESPIGPSPLALEAARLMLDQAHRYPGVSERNLRQKLAQRLGHGLNEHNLIVGNGGTDVLRLLTQAFVFDGGNTVMSRVTFPMYRILTTAFGGEPRIVEPTAEYRQDLEAISGMIDGDTRIVFLCSPNNPTGDIVTHSEAEAFLASVPDHVVVVFDESYCDYVSDPAYADSPAFVAQGRPVLAVRSFSKSGGLANLRVGYLVGPPELIHYVRHAELPFHTGDIALAAAAASLDDVSYQRRQMEILAEGRGYLYSAFRELDLTSFQSQANFVTVCDPPLRVADIVDRLLKKGFVVREMRAFGMPDAFRVSVGLPDENRRFIEALKEVLEFQREGV